MKRRILAIALSLCMILTLTPCVAIAAPATDFTDTDGHWAEEAIGRWAGYGIIEGYEGAFNPNGELTRAQLAAIIARLLNLPFSFMCASIKISMTGITVIEFSNEKGRLCSPVLTLSNDDSHARGLSIENKYEM